MITEKFRRSHPPVSHPDREEIPVLAVQMPSDPSVTRFYTALLAATARPCARGSAWPSWSSWPCGCCASCTSACW
jgi:hypothetical protein